MMNYDEIVRSPCRVEVQTPDIVFYPQESQAAACLHMDRTGYNTILHTFVSLVTSTFHILTDLSEPLDPVMATGNLRLAHVI